MDYYLAKLRREADAEFDRRKREAIIETTQVTGGSIAGYLALVGAAFAAAILVALGALTHQTQKMVNSPCRKAYAPLALASALLLVSMAGDAFSRLFAYAIGAGVIGLFTRHVVPRRLVEQKIARVQAG